MALKFGTSGVRGLVTEMTDRDCYLYSRAFARHLKAKAPEAKKVALAGDRRGSTPRIMTAVGTALVKEGLEVDNCGLVGTPAVSYHGMQGGNASIMVTGSHIPDDRNGIKFNMPWGEVLKPDEGSISRLYRELAEWEAGEGAEELPIFTDAGAFAEGAAISLGEPNAACQAAYIERFVKFLPGKPLEGTKVVFYQHSSVSREVFVEILEALGAEVVAVGWSDAFVPVDTEAVSEPERLAAWVAEHGADALVSTDGDADRPLVVDEKGQVVRGDVLGIVVADFLGAKAVATPVSCNTALEKSGRFGNVARTRIGSPYVIEAMQAAVEAKAGVVVGYEANGGFLTATVIDSPFGGDPLLALPTRDAVLPGLAILAAAKKKGITVSELVAELPPRYTRSGLQRGVPNDRGKALVKRFEAGGAAVVKEVFGEAFGEVLSLDFTDGARITFASADVVHCRPSGNAPEFRCYTESDTEAKAQQNNDTALEIIKNVV